MWSTWRSAGYAVKEGLGSCTRTNTECSQISAGRDENRQTRIRFLIKALQAEGWPAFRQALQGLVCESLPMRISLNWKGRAEGWVLRVVQSPGSWASGGLGSALDTPSHKPGLRAQSPGVFPQPSRAPHWTIFPSLVYSFPHYLFMRHPRILSRRYRTCCLIISEEESIAAKMN